MLFRSQKSILRLGGHGQQVAAVMNATVIADGDLVDQLADHKLHPEWQAVRVKMLEEMPKAIESHWLTKYKTLRDDYDPDVIGEQLAGANLGIWLPFLIAAGIKTAQGSSTVAIITTASIIFPILGQLGLTSELDKVWAIIAIGTGSMTVSHANDSYFWIVSQMGEIDVKTAYRHHTLATLIQGFTGLVVVNLLFYLSKLWV